MSHSAEFAKQTGLFLFLNKRKQVMSIKVFFAYVFFDLKNKQKSAKIIKDNVYHTKTSTYHISSNKHPPPRPHPIEISAPLPCPSLSYMVRDTKEEFDNVPYY